LKLSEFLTTFKSVGELRYLLSRKTKFSELSTVGRDCLGGKSLDDLISLLVEITGPLKKAIGNIYNYSIPSQVAEYCLTDSTDVQKMSYVNAIQDITRLPDPEAVDRKNALWFWGEISKYLESTIIEFDMFAHLNKLNPDKEIIENARLFVNKKLEACKKLPPIEDQTDYVHDYGRPFEEPQSILSLIYDEIKGPFAISTLIGLGDILWNENIKVLESETNKGPIVEERINLLKSLKKKNTDYSMILETK
jgi:hypothetical protein